MGEQLINLNARLLSPIAHDNYILQVTSSYAIWEGKPEFRTCVHWNEHHQTTKTDSFLFANNIVQGSSETQKM